LKMGDSGSWIGLDESGKGDYFGPLVVGAVFVTQDRAQNLLAAGVRDSKKTSDKRVLEMDAVIRGMTATSVVAIGPQRYNELYEKMRNLNRLLAWAHARALENLLGQVECPRALADQFGDEGLIKKALMDKGKTITLEQRPRAEEDVAVAAASIIARAEFLRRLKRLSEEVQLPLPKGASKEVQEAVRGVMRKLPSLSDREALLKRVAKWHFKTTKAAMAP
jgi:ribonuclease HIII